MYFLWRKTPAAVLGQGDKWIQKGEIQSKIDQVRIFEDAGEARLVQRSKYSKSGVSVLSQKTFKEKTHIKSLPVFRSVTAETSSRPINPTPGMEPCVYNEYLDQLCAANNGQRTRVTLPPANVEETTKTPNINKAKDLLARILSRLASLESQEYQLREEIKQLDLLNSDRLHQIEMMELTDEESVIIVRAIHEAQIERRRRKNDLITLLAEKEILSKIDVNELKQAIKVIEGLSDQAYHCRVLTEEDPVIGAHKQRERRDCCA